MVLKSQIKMVLLHLKNCQTLSLQKKKTNRNFPQNFPQFLKTKVRRRWSPCNLNPCFFVFSFTHNLLEVNPSAHKKCMHAFQLVFSRILHYNLLGLLFFLIKMQTFYAGFFNCQLLLYSCIAELIFGYYQISIGVYVGCVSSSQSL